MVNNIVPEVWWRDKQVALEELEETEQRKLQPLEKLPMQRQPKVSDGKFASCIR
jgi:hypothetical protein